MLTYIRHVVQFELLSQGRNHWEFSFKKEEKWGLSFEFTIYTRKRGKIVTLCLLSLLGTKGALLECTEVGFGVWLYTFSLFSRLCTD